MLPLNNSCIKEKNKNTKNSLFPCRTPEGLKLQEEKVGKKYSFLSMCVLVWSVLAVTF